METGITNPLTTLDTSPLTTILIGPINVSGPAAYWKFDVITSGNHLDSITSLPIPTNGSSLVTGIINDGVTMTGATGGVTPVLDTGLVSQLGISGTDASFTFWFKINSYGSSVQPLKFGFNWSGSDPDPTFFTQIAPPGFFAYTIRLAIESDSNNFFYDGTSTTTGVWHFVAMTYSSTGTASIYVDNVLAASSSIGTSVGGSKGEVLGQYYSALGPAPDVVFDEVGCWTNHVLSTLEISHLWNGGAGARPPGV